MKSTQHVKHAQARGVLGHAPSGKFLKMNVQKAEFGNFL